MTLAFVIGNYFSASAGPQIWTIEQCLAAASQGLLPHRAERVSFGQGVPLHTALELKRLLVGTGNLEEDQVHIAPYLYRKISKEIVHKRYTENVVLSELDRGSPVHFRSNLHIDAVPEIVQDHLTGKHLPGMLLLEAARQGSNAVLEARKARGEIDGDLCVAALSWRTLFRQFVYPLPVTLSFKIESSEQRMGCLEEVLTAEFCQLGQNVGRIESRYRLLEKKKTAQIEEALLGYLGKLMKEDLCLEQII